MCLGDEAKAASGPLIPPDVPGMPSSGMSDRNRLQHNMAAASGGPMPAAPPAAPPIKALYASNEQVPVTPAQPVFGGDYDTGNGHSQGVTEPAPKAIPGGDFDTGNGYLQGVTEPATQPTATYAIQPGDSLSKIAKLHFGDASRWPEIFELNRDRIEDPNRIFVGDEIRLPP